MPEQYIVDIHDLMHCSPWHRYMQKVPQEELAMLAFCQHGTTPQIW